MDNSVALLNDLYNYNVDPFVYRFLFYVWEGMIMSYESLYLDWTLTLSDEHDKRIHW